MTTTISNQCSNNVNSVINFLTQNNNLVNDTEDSKIGDKRKANFSHENKRSKVSSSHTDQISGTTSTALDKNERMINALKKMQTITLFQSDCIDSTLFCGKMAVALARQAINGSRDSITSKILFLSLKENSAELIATYSNKNNNIHALSYLNDERLILRHRGEHSSVGMITFKEKTFENERIMTCDSILQDAIKMNTEWGYSLYKKPLNHSTPLHHATWIPGIDRMFYLERFDKCEDCFHANTIIRAIDWNAPQKNEIIDSEVIRDSKNFKFLGSRNVLIRVNEDEIAITDLSEKVNSKFAFTDLELSWQGETSDTIEKSKKIFHLFETTLYYGVSFYNKSKTTEEHLCFELDLKIKQIVQKYDMKANIEKIIASEDWVCFQINKGIGYRSKNRDFGGSFIPMSDWRDSLGEMKLYKNILAIDVHHTYNRRSVFWDLNSKSEIASCDSHTFSYEFHDDCLFFSNDTTLKKLVMHPQEEPITQDSKEIENESNNNTSGSSSSMADDT